MKLEFDIYEDDVTEMIDLFSMEIAICIDSVYARSRFPARRTSQASSAVPENQGRTDES